MKNLEIKAYCQDESVFDRFKSEGMLDQTDTYYKCDNGRLKLREENSKTYKFIHYQRENMRLYIAKILWNKRNTGVY